MWEVIPGSREEDRGRGCCAVVPSGQPRLGAPQLWVLWVLWVSLLLLSVEVG